MEYFSYIRRTAARNLPTYLPTYLLAASEPRGGIHPSQIDPAHTHTRTHLLTHTRCLFCFLAAIGRFFSHFPRGKLGLGAGGQGNLRRFLLLFLLLDLDWMGKAGRGSAGARG
jgi:hypothetical protein